MRSLITVGVSNGSTSRAAVRWALGQALQNDDGVVLLHVLPAHAEQDDMVEAAHLLRGIVDEMSEGSPVVAVAAQILHGAVIEELAQASNAAAMLVVGGPSGTEKADDTPISWRLAVEASCPVVVVPDGDRRFDHGLVLGVGDSPYGRAAAAFAASRADSTGQRLMLVRAWPGEGQRDGSRQAALLERRDKRASDHMLADALDEAARVHPRVHTDARSSRGPVSEVLQEASRHAQLLVLGQARPRPGSGSSLSPVIAEALAHMRTPIALVHETHPQVVDDDPQWEDAVAEGWADVVPAARA